MLRSRRTRGSSGPCRFIIHQQSSRRRHQHDTQPSSRQLADNQQECKASASVCGFLGSRDIAECHNSSQSQAAAAAAAAAATATATAATATATAAAIPDAGPTAATSREEPKATPQAALHGYDVHCPALEGAAELGAAELGGCERLLRGATVPSPTIGKHREGGTTRAAAGRFSVMCSRPGGSGIRDLSPPTQVTREYMCLGILPPPPPVKAKEEHHQPVAV